MTLGRLLDVLHGAPLHLLPPVVVVEGLGSGELEGAEAPLAALSSASKSSIRRFVITEKAPTRAFSWLKAATTAFTFKTLC